MRDLFCTHLHILDNDPPHIVTQKWGAGFTTVLGESGVAKAHFVGHLLGFDFTQSQYLREIEEDALQIRNRAFHYISQFFTAVSKANPTVIILEDIHWADKGSLDLYEYIAQQCHQTPLLLLALTRPILWEQRPLWGQHITPHTRLDLPTLTPSASRHLIQQLLCNVAQLPSSLLDLIIQNADGNPYYVEELINMFIEEGVIIKGGKQWGVNLERLHIERLPTTLIGLLQASLDRLPETERAILQQASVVGRTFWDAVLSRMNQIEQTSLSAADVQDNLHALRGRQLIFQQDTSTFARTQELIFKHAMLREVTYSSVLKRLRRHYHALVADWLIEHSGERATEHTCSIAEHLRHAGEAQRAITYLRQAGKQAATRYANNEAITFFTHALALVPPEDIATQAALLLDREKVYELCGERESQIQDLTQLATLSDKVDEATQAQIALRQANHAGLINDYQATIISAQLAIALAQNAENEPIQAVGYLRWGWALRRLGRNEDAQLQMTQALTIAQSAGLRSVEADCCRSLGVAFDKQGREEQAKAYYAQALTLYQRISDRRGEGRALSGLGSLASAQQAYTLAQTYYQQNLAICREIGDRAGAGWALWWLGGTCYKEQDYASARDYYEQSLVIRREVGDRSEEALTLTHLGRTLQYLNAYEAARAYCQQALHIYEELGNETGAGWALWWVGGICYWQGDYESARSYYRQVLPLREANGRSNDVAFIRRRLGQLCLWLEDNKAAQQYYMAALEASRQRNKMWDEGYLLNSLGDVHCALGELETAQAYYEQSYTLRQELSVPHLLIEPLAGLAHICLLRDTAVDAQPYIEGILPHIQEHPPRWIGDMLRVYLICLQLLQANNDPRLTTLLPVTQALLTKRAANLDPAWHHMFWQVPVHHALKAILKQYPL